MQSWPEIDGKTFSLLLGTRTIHNEGSLVPRVRLTLLEALEKQKAITRKSLREQARKWLEETGHPLTEENLRMAYLICLDLASVRGFQPEELRGLIELAQQREKFFRLDAVVNQEHPQADRVLSILEEIIRIPPDRKRVPDAEVEELRVALFSRFVSDQLQFVGIAKKYLSFRSFAGIFRRLVAAPASPGRIGGKAAGMLVAHQVVMRHQELSDREKYLEIAAPESYYIPTDVCLQFINENDLQYLYSLKYLDRQAIAQRYPDVQEDIKEGTFPKEAVEAFREFLDGMGEHPLIVRSSSLLEDSYGLSFSGKYDSFFLTNQGPLETRLAPFVSRIKDIYSSVFSPSALVYRRDNNLIDFNEGMAVLVQKVVGRKWGRYFFPAASGVGFSRASIAFSPRLDRKQGMLRLVVGLGTRAVDRVGEDYARMVYLSHPTLRPEVGADRIRRYSQKKIDLLDLDANRFSAVSLPDLLAGTRHPEWGRLLSVREEDLLAPPVGNLAEIPPDRACVTLDGLIRDARFCATLKRVLEVLEEAYLRPVDIEFAYDDGRLYLLQCRTLSLYQGPENVRIPDPIPPEKLVFTSTREVMTGRVEQAEYLVYVSPRAYQALATAEEKIAVGRVVSRLNQRLAEKIFVLLGPGRWGSRDLNLGVRVNYEDINHTRLLGEIARTRDGITPELSFGTHFFQDLVEANILPLPLYPDEPGNLFREDFLLACPNQLAALAPGDAALAGVIHVVHLPSATDGEYLQIYLDGDANRGVAFLEKPRAPAVVNSP